MVPSQFHPPPQDSRSQWRLRSQRLLARTLFPTARKRIRCNRHTDIGSYRGVAWWNLLAAALPLRAAAAPAVGRSSGSSCASACSMARGRRALSDYLEHAEEHCLLRAGRLRQNPRWRPQSTEMCAARKDVVVAHRSIVCCADAAAGDARPSAPAVSLCAPVSDSARAATAAMPQGSQPARRRGDIGVTCHQTILPRWHVSPPRPPARGRRQAHWAACAGPREDVARAAATDRR